MFGENANDDSRGEAREKELSSRCETLPFRFFTLWRGWIVCGVAVNIIAIGWAFFTSSHRAVSSPKFVAEFRGVAIRLQIIRFADSRPSRFGLSICTRNLDVSKLRETLAGKARGKVRRIRLAEELENYAVKFRAFRA